MMPRSRPSSDQTTAPTSGRVALSAASERLESRRLLSGTTGGPGDPDDTFAEAIVLGLIGPAGATSGAVDISTDGDDVDLYRFDVAAGQTVGFDIDRAVGSTLDPVMRLFDDTGTQLQFEDDGVAPDEPFGTDDNRGGYFEFTFTTAGTFYVGVSAFGNDAYDPITGDGDNMAATNGGYELVVTDRFAAIDSGGQFYPSAIVITGTDAADTLAFDVDLATGDVLTTLNGHTLRFLDGRLDAQQVLDAGEGNDTIQVVRVATSATSLAYSLVARGGSGDDSFVVGTGDLDSSIFGGLTIDGGDDTDNVLADDTADLGNDTFVLSGTDGGTLTKPGNVEPFSGFGLDSIEAVELQTNDEANTIRVEDGTGVTILAGGGNDLIDVNGNDPATPVIVRAQAGDDVVRIDADNGGIPASARFVESERLDNLVLFPQAKLTVDAGGDKVIDVGFLTTADASVDDALFDLNDNAFVHRQPVAGGFFRSRLASAYDGGTWTGVEGIISSVARDSAIADGLAYGTAVDIGVSGVNGQSLDAASFVIAYTLLGDADLNHGVDLADFGRLRSGFGSSSATFALGDFNYDGVVNLADFGLLRASFGQTVSLPSLFSNDEL
ncbi:MAG: pre-peptidase C-terminal domain-containing protein [Planctomycetota bacterium]